jgi:hypothetical protein
MDKHIKELKKLAKTIYQSKLEELTENQVKELEMHLAAKENMENRDPMESVKMIMEEAKRLEAKHLAKEMKETS